MTFSLLLIFLIKIIDYSKLSANSTTNRNMWWMVLIMW